MGKKRIIRKNGKQKRKEKRMEHYMSVDMIQMFKEKLVEEEKSEATIYKYSYDLDRFYKFLSEQKQVTKEIVIKYKQKILHSYAISSVNSIITALNRFFKEMGWIDCVVKTQKVQASAFRAKDRELKKEEYYRLLRTAKEKGRERLYLVMETICSTGIRVSELPFITVEALYSRRAEVNLKGKTRVVLLSLKLCKELKRYVKEKKIKSGPVFITRTGKTLDRSNILHDMKALCKDARVKESKVFPHNLRHLFAITYYQMEKDLSHLADLLGHSSVNTTRIYTLTSGEEEIKKIEQLELVV